MLVRWPFSSFVQLRVVRMAVVVVRVSPDGETLVVVTIESGFPSSHSFMNSSGFSILNAVEISFLEL